MTAAPPRTIKQYQSALARLGCPLPAGKLTLEQYKQRYEAAEKAAASTENVGENEAQSAPLRRAVSPPVRQRPTKNIPLSQQTTPVSQPPAEPSIDLIPDPVEETIEEQPAAKQPAAEQPAAEQSAAYEKPITQRRSMIIGLCFGAALLSLAAAASFALGGHAPNVHIDPMKRSIVDESFPLDSTCTNEATGEEVTEDGMTYESNAEDVEAAPGAEVMEPSGDAAASVEPSVAAEEATEPAEAVVPVEVPVVPVETSDAVAVAAPASKPVVEAAPPPTSTTMLIVEDSSKPAPPPAPIANEGSPVPAIPEAARGSTLSMIIAFIGGILSTGLRYAVRASVWLSVTLTNSEELRWVATTAVDGWWTMIQLILRGFIEVLVLVAAVSADVLSRSVPWLVANGPAAAKALASCCTAHPQLTCACVATVGALHFFRRAGFWYGRYRAGQHAGRAAQIDASARWVLAELRAHTERWESVSGRHAHVLPLPPVDLAGRVPHSILADRQLWEQVAATVEAHSCVRTSRDGWLFCDPLVRP